MKHKHYKHCRSPSGSCLRRADSIIFETKKGNFKNSQFKNSSYIGQPKQIDSFSNCSDCSFKPEKYHGLISEDEN